MERVRAEHLAMVLDVMATASQGDSDGIKKLGQTLRDML